MCLVNAPSPVLPCCTHWLEACLRNSSSVCLKVSRRHLFTVFSTLMTSPITEGPRQALKPPKCENKTLTRTHRHLARGAKHAEPCAGPELLLARSPAFDTQRGRSSIFPAVFWVLAGGGQRPMPAALRSSQTRDCTRSTAVTRATAVTPPGPSPAESQRTPATSLHKSYGHLTDRHQQPTRR